MKTEYIFSVFSLIGNIMRCRAAMIILMTVLLVAASSLPAGADFVGRPIPSHMNGSSLGKALQAVRQDLAVENLLVRTRTDPKSGKTIAVISVRIHNMGSAKSRANAVSFSLHPSSGYSVSKLKTIPPLPPNDSRNFSWATPVTPGNSAVIVSVDDPDTPNNNMARKTFRVKKITRRPIAKTPLIHGKPAAKLLSSNKKDNLRIPQPPHPLLRPDLAVTKIIFNDFKARKKGETWVEVEIRNLGTATSPPTRVEGTLKRPDGSIEHNSFNVPRLRAKGNTIIKGPIRMTRGINTLTMRVIDPATPTNNTMTRKHRFGSLLAVPGRKRQRHNDLRPQHARATGQQIKATHLSVELTNKTKFGHAVVGKRRFPPRPLPGNGDIPGPPDLKILASELTPVPLSLGKEIRCVVEVVNIGGEISGNNSAHISGELIVSGPLGREPALTAKASAQNLAPIDAGGGKAKLEFHYKVPVSGRYQNHVRVYFTSPRGEINMGNNSKEWSYDVQPLPDLAVWITRPSDVRVGGHKRWFHFKVKNIGEASSQETTMRLHIDSDGTHTYKVPSLAPGETFPVGKPKKRGIRWWKKGRKHYQIVVNPDHTFAESDWHNNTVKDSLKVYLSKGVQFNPKATVYHFPGIYRKNLAPLTAGVEEKIYFRIYNDGNGFTEPGRFTINIVPPDHPDKHLWFMIDVDELFPGESFYRPITVTFATAGRATYTIRRKLKKVHRKRVEYVPFDRDVYARGHIDIQPQLGVPPRR